MPGLSYCCALNGAGLRSPYLCPSQIKSEHIGDAVRPGPDGKECARLCEHGVMSVHPRPTISACAPHCNNSCTTAGRDEDVAHMMGQKPIIRLRRVGHTPLIDVRG